VNSNNKEMDEPVKRQPSPSVSSVCKSRDIQKPLEDWEQVKCSLYRRQ